MSQSIARPTTQEGKLTAKLESRYVCIPPVGLAGTLRIPQTARAFIAFAHGSDSSRFSPRNMAVAEGLNAGRLGTLLFDLLTSKEEADRANVFDVALVAERLVDSVIWLDRESPTSHRPLGLFGASTGAAAALVAAAQLGDRISAVVSRGGPPDLAGKSLDQLRTPTLLIGRGGLCGDRTQRGDADTPQGSRGVRDRPGASHLFPEPGALEAVIDHATRWLAWHLAATSPKASSQD